jgi:hypothetical protein
MTEKEFKDWQNDLKRQIAESGLTQEQWVDRWADRVFGPEDQSESAPYTTRAALNQG